VGEAAEILLRNKISGAPVVDKRGRIAGMITQADLFKVLISHTGVDNRGVQFAFQLEDHPGAIKEVADIIRKYGGLMVSLLSTYEHAPRGYRQAYIRMNGVNRSQLEKLKRELREKAILLYMIDHRENRREIY
jgi:acetoin utilization protein AcuB